MLDVVHLCAHHHVRIRMCRIIMYTIGTHIYTHTYMHIQLHVHIQLHILFLLVGYMINSHVFIMIIVYTP